MRTVSSRAGILHFGVKHYHHNTHYNYLTDYLPVALLTIDMKLFLVKGKRRAYMRRVEPTTASLNEGDVYGIYSLLLVSGNSSAITSDPIYLGILLSRCKRW